MKTRSIICKYLLSFLLLASFGASAYGFYDPSVGKWVSRDPIGEPGFNVVAKAKKTPRENGWNLYAFVKQNPVNAIDPDGLKCVLLSNGMVADTDKGTVVYWRSNPDATARFIRRCNFKKNLPLLGACLIVLGAGPEDPADCRKKCHEDFDRDGDVLELQFCIRRCNGGWHGPTPRPIPW